MSRYSLVLWLSFLLAGCSLIALNPSSEMQDSAPNVVDSGSLGNQAADLLKPVPTEVLQAPLDDAYAFDRDSTQKERHSLLPDDAETAEDMDLLQASPVFFEEEGESVSYPEIVFDFPVVENDRVRYFVDLYSGPGRHTFARWLERSGRYIPMMRPIFAEYGLPEDLVYLAMVESGFNSRAYSWAHAVGPWQFIESTGRMYGLQNDWWFDERRDPEKATHAAARFLRDLHKQFEGDWYLAVAAYNAGPGRIQGAIRTLGSRDFWQISRGQHLQLETRQYVPKLLATLIIVKDLDKYGFSNLEYYEPLAYELVKVPSATDLELVAELCGISYEEIKALNPELKRWSTPPGRKNHELRIPLGSKERFVEAYAKVPADQRVRYHRHRVKSGDTLLKLAGQYNIRVEDIITLNSIRDPRALRIGQDLILPLRQGYTTRPIKELADDHDRTRRRSYTVRQGDSLWSIARRFEVTEKDLRVWNKLGWSNVLRPGQVLIVSSSAVSQAASRTAKRSNQPLTRLTYTVKPGDTLWDIGRRYQVATRDIMNWNNLGENHILRPGDQLTLMVPESQSG